MAGYTPQKRSIFNRIRALLVSLINVPRALGQKIENCTIDATREVLGKLSSAEILAWHDFGEKPFWLTNSVVLHSFMKAGGEGAMQLLRQGNHDVPVAPVPDLEPVAHEHVEIPKAPDSPALPKANSSAERNRVKKII